MTKWKDTLKYFRLSLLFAFIVFLIFICTLGLVFLGTQLLAHLGVLNKTEFRQIPLFMFCIASAVLGTIIAVIFSKKPLRPLRELMDATDQIADGDYSVRLDFKGPAEFRRLSKKFNHMAEELHSVELLRTDFVNNFSHEFKTPIVSIRGFAKALKWDDLTREERNNYLETIISEAERLAALSSNVLYLSKIENQAILTEKQPFNLSEQLRLAVVLLDKKLQEKQIELLFDSQEFFVSGNEEMLKQVWINILDNAIKFSPAGGRIAICIQDTSPEMLTVSITDHGCGIAPEAQTHIFDKFYQSDSSHATDGNGLGLAIVRKIISLHDGTISVQSSDAGTTFDITLHQYI